ncbi:hypothetical protein E2C01_039750 [Portunus trituberculatus]|uniref:Uncharacterized protein n=1 Tax=Portunus trituberculatus TaxID=210409 RepID=A0A5B7FFJ7_PORTR|nr:hypothetical protein [Portunus trituberculatus]
MRLRKGDGAFVHDLRSVSLVLGSYEGHSVTDWLLQGSGLGRGDWIKDSPSLNSPPPDMNRTHKALLTQVDFYSLVLVCLPAVAAAAAAAAAAANTGGSVTFLLRVSAVSTQRPESLCAFNGGLTLSLSSFVSSALLVLLLHLTYESLHNFIRGNDPLGGPGLGGQLSRDTTALRRRARQTATTRQAPDIALPSSSSTADCLIPATDAELLLEGREGPVLCNWRLLKGGVWLVSEGLLRERRTRRRLLRESARQCTFMTQESLNCFLKRLSV